MAANGGEGIGMEAWHLWEAPALPFNRREILRYAGWPGAETPESTNEGTGRNRDEDGPEHLSPEGLPLEEILREAEGIRCRAVWRAVDPASPGPGLTAMIAGSRALARFLEGCGGMALFALTAGTEMDRIIARERVRSPLRGLLAHAVGAERTETACDALTREVLTHFPGMKAAGRFSPGYGDLPLNSQAWILTALDAGRRLGITVNSSSLLIPAKSVTAVIGLADKPQGARIRGCGVCRIRENCVYRERGTTCGIETAGTA